MSVRRRYDGPPAASDDTITISRERFNRLRCYEEVWLRDHRRQTPAKRANQAKPADRKMTPDAIDAMLDLGLYDGRIEAADADKWRRSLEASPAETTRRLAKLPPDPVRAERNYFASPEGRLYELDAAARLGIRPEDVI